MEDPAPPPSEDDSDPNPEIKQGVNGDRNQVIGQAIDSTIVNFAGDGQVINLTINDRIPTASLPPSNIVVQNLTQQEYRQRQVLLNKVRDAWVKGVLEKSLHARVSIELGLQERPDLVQQPFSDVAEFAAAPGQALPEGTPATTVFDRLGSGRTLLIVGEPGSGKTIALLKLAEDALDRTEPDLRQQIPVVFNLSSWARKPQSIEQWLIQELLEKYQVSKALGKTWVESEALMLLLDGLDEVKAEQRNACVQALNQFMQTHGTTEIVICCRIGDYQMLQDRLILRSAICLQPLTAAQIDRYFEQAGDRLSALKAVLPQDAELQELAKSPLMLSVMSLAYQDFTPEQLTVGGKIEDYRKRLFATYIDRMFQRRGTTQQYSREDSQRWLSWLAGRLQQKSQIFLIEQMQPNWLINELGKYYQLINFVFYFLFVELSASLLWIVIILNHGKVKGDWLSFIGLGLMIGFLIWGAKLDEEDIILVESLVWSRKKAQKYLSNQLWIFIYLPLLPVLFELVFRVFFNITSSSFNRQMLGVFFSFLASAIVLSSINGVTISNLEVKSIPNQGIWNSLRNIGIGLLIGGFGGGVIGFVFLLSNAFGYRGLDLLASLPEGRRGFVTVGLIGALYGVLHYGVTSCIQHFSLRFILWYKNHIPWNYAHFLDYATERLFLQKVGGGYTFVHRMLLEHFAEMSIEQEKR
jgi:NACHT domain